MKEVRCLRSLVTSASITTLNKLRYKKRLEKSSILIIFSFGNENFQNIEVIEVND